MTFRAEQFHIKPSVAKQKHWGPVSILREKAKLATTANLIAAVKAKQGGSLLKSVKG